MHWVPCHQGHKQECNILTSSLSLPWATWPGFHPGEAGSQDKNDALKWSRKQLSLAMQTLVLGEEVSVTGQRPLLTCVQLLVGPGGQTLQVGSLTSDIQPD